MSERKYGYILLPRSLMEQEWYSNLSCRLLALHLLQVASYKTTEHPILGDLPAGSYVTTYRELAAEIERDTKTIQRCVSRMVEGGFIAITPYQKCLVIQVVWTDFVELRDCGDATTPATKVATTPATKSNATKDSVSVSYGDSASDPATTPATKVATDIATNINKDKLNNIKSHTRSIYIPVETKNAPAREAHTHTHLSADAQLLSEWITRNTPELLDKNITAIPLSVEDIRFLCELYDYAANSELIHKALSELVRNEAYYCDKRPLRVMARKYIETKLEREAKEKAESDKVRYYNMDEVYEVVRKTGKTQDQLFQWVAYNKFVRIS